MFPAAGQDAEQRDPYPERASGNKGDYGYRKGGIQPDDAEIGGAHDQD